MSNDQNNFYAVKFQPSRFPQARELNEVQENINKRLQRLGDVFLTDGGIVEGGQVSIDQQSGFVQLAPVKIYLKGEIHTLAAGTLNIPVLGEASIGVVLTEQVITYLDDPSLRGSAPNTRAFGEPGADRTRYVARWSWSGEALTAGDYFGVYSVKDGTILNQTPPPELDGVNSALARYDRDANGSYIVDGMEVLPLGLDDAGNQAFVISAGTANVWGFKITRDVDLRHLEPESPDLSAVHSEPHEYTAGKTIILNYGPIAQISEITALREATADVTHGAYAGAKDALPQTSISNVIKVRQGNTVYTKDTDFKVVGDSIDWSPSGAEPAPSSTYSVTFHYYDSVQAQNLDPIAQSLTIADAVEGSTLLFDYTWKLPRLDMVALDKTGAIKYIKGRSSAHNPWPPNIPADLLPLGTITNLWGRTSSVERSRTRSVHYTELLTYADWIDDLYHLVASERLQRVASAQEPSAKRGIFVDPFLNDDMRDQGVAQTAAIVDGELLLPIKVSVVQLELGEELLQAEYQEEEIIAQPLITGSMKINPYMAFDPLPGLLRLQPPKDFWRETRTEWTSTVTRIIRGARSGVTTSVQTQQRRSRAVPFVRQREVAFTIEGFGAGEELVRLTFDGIEVEAQS